MPPWRATLSSMIFISALFSGLMRAETADFAVTGARIYTMNPRNPVVSAIAVKDGKVLAAGDNIERYLGPLTRRIDAKGLTIVPGLIDSHLPMRSFGDSLEILDLRPANSADLNAPIVGQAARSTKPAQWMLTR